MKNFTYVEKLTNWGKIIWPSVSIFGLKQNSHYL